MFLIQHLCKSKTFYFYWWYFIYLSVTAMAAEPSALNQQSYLMLDRRVVADVRGVTLRLGQVTKHPANPLMREDKPWEVRYDNVYANVLYDKDEDVFKCFYSPFIIDEATSGTPPAERHIKKYHVTPSREMGLCYACSKDGIHWTKPELGIIELNGSNRNNILIRGIHGAGVILDSTDPDASRRYKLFAGSQVPGGERYMIVAFSRNGINWTKPIPCPEIKADGDTHNNVLWSKQLNRYVGFTRAFTDQRLVMRTESQDFINWSKAIEVWRGDTVNQTYAVQVFATHGIYLGMLAVFNTITDRVHGELAVSDDTIHWRRVCPSVPFVPNSQQPGDYDYGCVYIANSPIQVDDDIWIYYGASNAPHSGWRDSYLALASLRRGRWAGYEHRSAENPKDKSYGRITTEKVVCCGRKLKVNLEAPKGTLRVGVLDEPQLAIEVCQPITGNFLDAEVNWESGADLSTLIGKPIQLEFQIENGVLYEFAFGS